LREELTTSNSGILYIPVIGVHPLTQGSVMDQLSPATLEILHKNGWTETRHVDIHKYEVFFEETQQETSSLIVEFLSRFGDMKISFTNKQDPNWVHWFLIDPIEARESISPEQLASYTHRWIKKPLCVIALHDDGSMFAVTPEGETYSFFDKWVVKFGNTPYEALNNLVDIQKPILRVLPP
jgi:hypothetical protein